MQFWHKKAIFSGITKFQKFFRKIRTDAVTLKSSPHSEQLFCHSVFLCNLLLTVERSNPKTTARAGIGGKFRLPFFYVQKLHSSYLVFSLLTATVKAFFGF